MRKLKYKWILLLPIMFLLTSCGGKYQEPVLLQEEPNHFEVEQLCSVEHPPQEMKHVGIAGTSRFFYVPREDKVEIWQYDLENCTLDKAFLVMEDMSFVDGNRIGFTNTDVTHRILCESVPGGEKDGGVYFCDYDLEGVLQNKRNVTEAVNAVSQKYPHRMRMIESPGGELILFCEDEKDKNYVIVISETGETKNCIKLGTAHPYDWILMENDKLFLIANYQTSFANSLFELDLEKGECRLLIKNLPGSENRLFCEFVKGRDNQNLYYQTDDTLWKYNFERNEVSKEISFLDVSLDGKFINTMMQEENGSWCAIWNNRENETYDFIRLHKTGEKVAKDSRVELVYAIVGSKQLYANDVNLFNSSGNKAKVTIKEYEDEERLLADLIAGEPVDIVELGNESLYSVLERKGMLEDLKQYLLQDPGISESDFLPTALKIYANDGKLYSIPYSVSLHVMMCDTLKLENRQSWDFSGFKDFIECLPERKNALRGSNNQDILVNLCAQYMDHFIDRKENSCNFMSEEFYSFLEISSLFPALDDSEEAWNTIMKGFEEGENALACVNIGDFETYAYFRTLFASKGKIMGYPADSGSGVGIQNGSYSAPAIMTGCQHKEEAWEYIKSTLTKNYELFHAPVFASYLPSFDKIIEEMEKRAESEEAKKMTTPPATASEIRMIREYLEGAEPIQCWNADIFEIITEEAGAYFAGQKSVEATAEVIQNRVMLYLNEE